MNVDLGPCLVTGAAGFLGRSLVAALLERGCRVRALVHRAPLPIEHERLECVRGDVRDRDAMLRACETIETVFHTAARIGLLGGRAVTEEYRRPIHEVNVGGTENVLAACRQQGVGRLVYTSSVDVCLDGSPIENMNRHTPYASHPKSVYAETKIAAEQMVLRANGDGGLLTCAIRADGIYGPDENLILDPIVKNLAAGRLKVGIGSATTLQDNSYVDNLVHGEILAALHLVPGGSACGKAYFITDYEPQNVFEFFRPLIEGLGFEVPKRRIPSGALRPILKLWEWLHFRIGVAPPPLTPHELDKVSVTHYGSIEEAERDLGYRPIKSVRQALQECLPYCESLLAACRGVASEGPRGAVTPR
jgi:3beta-hydroxy-delta5-steroid dehydrogenase/steroid delta-isomerase